MTACSTLQGVLWEICLDCCQAESKSVQVVRVVHHQAAQKRGHCNIIDYCNTDVERRASSGSASITLAMGAIPGKRHRVADLLRFCAMSIISAVRSPSSVPGPLLERRS